jgi:hypothetical protein
MNHGNFLFAGCDVPYRYLTGAAEWWASLAWASSTLPAQLGMGQFNSSSQRIRCQRARLTSYSRWLDATDRLTGVVVSAGGGTATKLMWASVEVTFSLRARCCP